MEEGSLSPKLVESLIGDLKLISAETKKKYPAIKDASEEAINKLRNGQQVRVGALNQVLYPLIQGCETKDLKIAKLCLVSLQRLITQCALDEKAAKYIVDVLWILTDNSIEEIKVLQSSTLLLTTNNLVQGETLAKCLALCFRLHFAKDPMIINAAGATVRQLISLVFERAVQEDKDSESEDISVEAKLKNVPSSGHSEEIKVVRPIAPKSLSPHAADAYLLFQDLVQLVNAEQPCWLLGMTEMTRTFGIELLETVLSTFPSIFAKHVEFSSLLKERVCALVIKLFSPNVKAPFRNQQLLQQQQSGTTLGPLDKPFFPVSMRLLRLVSVLIHKYHDLLVTECEIFLSLLLKFLDPDKPCWQRALALEILHRLLAQPPLIQALCSAYDLQPHATNILQDTVNSLAACVQALFVQENPGNSNGPSSQPALGPPTLLGGVPLGPGISPQPALAYRGAYVPLAPLFVQGQPRATFLELMDKNEPPIIPEGYCLSVAYATLLDTVRSISLLIEGEGPHQVPPHASTDEKVAQLHLQLISSTWCGLLAAFTLLLEASTEESGTESVLKALQTYASLCGRVQLSTPRDAFITSLCKACLPPHYTITVLNSVPAASLPARSHHNRTPSQDWATGSGGGEETAYRGQNMVVAVGTPMPTPNNATGPSGPVVLTAKNVQCMRGLLHLSHCHGAVLGTAWHLVLSTLQHLVWILGLKPASGGSLKSSGPLRSPDNAATALVPGTGSVWPDLPVLSAMLSRLFESSQYLDEVALHHLVDALCQLSQEAMDTAYANREPSLFAVAKLLETGLVNLDRIECLWRPLTNHLLEVCHHPAARMREWGLEAVTCLVRTALLHPFPTPLKDNQRLQTLLLSPLVELSAIHQVDVRQKQLDCVLHILHDAGDNLSYGWPLVINMIGAIHDSHGENLIRCAFQCLQLVVTDFLPILPCHCLPLTVDTTAKFGSQTHELNVSLTAIGLMWNVSDYFFQTREQLQVSLKSDMKVFPDFPGLPNMSAFDQLWMCLYTKLGDLCVDSRPAVRKSACQTLFSTVAAHGDLLDSNTWQAVVWQVLFPLLDKVRSLSSQASDAKVDPGGQLLIHHSRNTAQKQWAETQVLSLSGVARVFNTKRPLLQTLGDFPRAFALLLEFIENAALSKNNEVSLSALKAFQEVLLCKSEDADSDGPENVSWSLAWKVWLHVGMETPNSRTDRSSTDGYVPTQVFLTALVHLFPPLFQHMKDRFVSSDLTQLCQVLESCICVPVHWESSAFLLPSLNEPILTPLQDGVLAAMQSLHQVLSSGTAVMRAMLPMVFNQLLTFATYACQAPIKDLKASVGKQQSDWIALNYVPFGERAIVMVVGLYLQTSLEPSVIESHVLANILQCFRLPLSLRYDCTAQTTWRLALDSLIQATQAGLPVAMQQPQHFQTFWSQLGNATEEFLFPKSLVPLNQTTEEAEADEALDIRLISLLRDQVLPHATALPHAFIIKGMTLLNKGSVQAVTPDGEHAHLREELAKVCFDTLLQFSLNSHSLTPSTNSGDSPAKSPATSLFQFVFASWGEPDKNTEKAKAEDESKDVVSASATGTGQLLAVTALLHRFEQVLSTYVEEERLSGKCPLPRHRVAEVSFALQGLTTLISSLKKNPEQDYEKKGSPRSMWSQIVSLYPHLVNLTGSCAPQLARPLKEVLLQYADLLQPPLLTNRSLITSNGSLCSGELPH